MGKDTTIAVDLAKSVFEIAVSSLPGTVSKRRRLSRSAVLRFFGQHPASTVLLEACGSAHFWAREIEQLGHRVVLLPPQHVRRYRPRNKTDRARPSSSSVRSIPGIGLITATALAGFVGDLNSRTAIRLATVESEPRTKTSAKSPVALTKRNMAPASLAARGETGGGVGDHAWQAMQSGTAG